MNTMNTDASGVENTLPTSDVPKSDDQQFYVVIDPDGTFDHTSIRLDESEAIREYIQMVNMTTCMMHKDMEHACMELSDKHVADGWEIMKKHGARLCRVTINIVG